MNTLNSLTQVNIKTSIVVSQSSEVLEQLTTLSLEAKTAYEKEVVELLFNGEFPGILVRSSKSNKDVLFTSLSTGEIIFYEVAPAIASTTLTFCAIHFIVPKPLVDEFERKNCSLIAA